MTTTTTDAARWEAYWAGVGNEDWLAAKALLDLSPRVAGYVASHLSTPATNPRSAAGQEQHLDWEAAAAGIDQAGFSSTERRLADLVAALVTDQPLRLSDLALMGSWTRPVWTVLVEWATRGELTITGSRR